jgi:long-chain fatty acid transport protein
MTFPRTLLCSLVLLLTTRAALGQAGGAVFYENGSPDMGMSYAGANARAQDAATAFQNPAGMSHLDENQIMLGTFGLFIDLELELDAGTVSIPPGSTNGGGSQSQFAPGLGSFGVIKINDDWRVGFAVNALAASGTEYNQSWVGRTFVTENFLIIANLQPTVSYRVNDWLSVGAGINIVYGSLDQTFLATNLPGAAAIEIDDADDWAVGGTFGALFELNEQTRLGLTYRTEIELNLSGDIDVSAPLSVGIDSDFPLPMGVNVSVFHQLNETVALLGDVGWSNWSTFDKQPTVIGPISGSIPRDFDDTWRIGAGVQWEFQENWKLMGGFSYDSSPVDDDKRLPDIPVGEQFRFSIGMQHDVGEGKVFSVHYTALYQPMDVDSVSLPGGIVLNGDYDPSLIHILGASFGITF